MSLPYPQNTIWYVEAGSADGKYRTSGSAVAVSLQRMHQPKSRRTYLLTCAHVVRRAPGDGPKGEAGAGPVLPDIAAWGPDTGYAAKQRIKAELADEIDLFAADAAAAQDGSSPANDWVVLRLESSQASLGAESVKVTAESETDSGELFILGYPGGSDSFVHGKVVPTRSGELSFRDSYQGLVLLNGTETRPGMSGGGVFDEAGALAGLHRARFDAVLQCHCISIASIRDRLGASSFELVSGPDIKKPKTDPVVAQSHGRAHRFLGKSIVIAIVFLVAAVITALAIISGGSREEVTRTEFQLIDDETQEPIYRSIGVVFQRHQAPPDPPVRTSDFGKGELKGGFADVQVSTITGDEVHGYGDPELDQSGEFPWIRLKRTSKLEFNKSIRPQRADFEVPQQAYQTASNLTADEFPEDVLLRCRNKTPLHVDVFMYRYVPDELRSSWIPCDTCPPTKENEPPTTIYRFPRPFTPDGYFFIYASSHGRRVESDPLDSGNLFQSPNPIITVMPSTDPHDPQKITASLSGEFK